MGAERADRSMNFEVGESARNIELPTVAKRSLHDVDLESNRFLRKVSTRPRWELRYADSVVVADLAAMAVSPYLHKWWGQASGYDLTPIALGLIVMALTVVILGVARAWDRSVLGQGSQEFSRLLRAAVALAVVVGLAGLSLKRLE